MKKHKILQLLLLLSFFSATLIYGQNSIDPEKTKKFKNYTELLKHNSVNYNEIADLLYNNAQTDYEKSYANYIKGDIMYKASKYLIAVDYFEKSEKYGKNLDSIDIQRYYTNGLALAYRRAGLIEQSNEAWERVKKLDKKSKDKYTEAEYYYNLSKIYDIDESYCKSAEAKIKYLQLVPKEIQKTNPNYIFAVNSQLAYVQIKCGDFQEGEKNLQKANNYILDKSKIPTSSLYELYALSYALLSAKNGKNEEAKQLFDEAYNTAKKNKSITLRKLILTERLEANLDSAEKQVEFSKEINEINKIEQETTKELTKYETHKNRKSIKKEKNIARTFFIVASVFCAFVIFLLFYLYRRNKKHKLAYNEIIRKLDERKNEAEEYLPIKKQENATSTEKELENEEQIVKQLISLEQKHFFTNQNVSATQLAALLKINNRNLSYLLKKYRNEDFYNYLNNLRIEYFTQIVKDNPKYQKFKIAALSEMIGYTSHSQFTSNFKSKTGITPSQYITFLQKEPDAD